MDERERHKRKERSDTIWTFLIIAAFLMAWPIGIVLAILKGKNILPDLGMNTPTTTTKNYTQATRQDQGPTFARDWEPELRRQAERAREQTRQWSEQVKQQAEANRERSARWAVPVQEQKAKAQAAQPPKPEKKKMKLHFGRPMFITGICIAAVGALGFTSDIATVTSLGSFVRNCSLSLGITGVGAYLLLYGLHRMRQSKRLQEYATLLPSNGKYYDLKELAERTGRPYRQVLADIQKMVELGVWEKAWVDKKNGRLMFTAYAPEPAPEKPKEASVQEKPKEDGRAEQVLRRIRDANDRIADEAISRKIDRIGLLTGEIFRYVAQHPEREGELRTFMDYYLPQTLKILETYAQLEAQGVETENIRKAKDEISGVLDQLSESYERQLDKLFDTDVLDISADIEVMKQMLRSDGLTPDEMVLAAEKKKK